MRVMNSAVAMAWDESDEFEGRGGEDSILLSTSSELLKKSKRLCKETWSERWPSLAVMHTGISLHDSDVATAIFYILRNYEMKGEIYCFVFYGSYIRKKLYRAISFVPNEITNY